MLNFSSKRKSTKPNGASSLRASSSAAAGSNPVVVITTRTVQVVKPKPIVAKVADSKSQSVTPKSETPKPATKEDSKERRPASTPPLAKKSRLETPPFRIRSRANTPAGRDSSRASSARPSGPAFGSLEKPIPRTCSIEEDGTVPHVSSEEVVTMSLRKYKAFFRNLEDPEDQSFAPTEAGYPVVEIEYPNHNATERFPLLFPIDVDDYQPIKELINALRTIVECYLTPQQRLPFDGCKTLGALGATPPRSSPSPTMNNSTPTREPDPLFRSLEKAQNTRNGPLFVQTVETISSMLKTLKSEMMQNVRANFDSTPSQPNDLSIPPVPPRGGVPVQLWKTIMEETYQRSVGPDVKELTKYPAFSSRTYGELTVSFVSDLVHRMGLEPGKNFVDLGCGVGNCVFQAAIQSGCNAYGIELHPPPATLAFKQRAEFLARLRMWGLSAGSVDIVKGDFCESEDVKEWMKTADVVLVNNYIFDAELNSRLSYQFLDLREGAKIIALKPFGDNKLNERTASSPLAILQGETREYKSGSVSWTAERGQYFVYTVNRSQIHEYMEASPESGGRARKTRAGRNS